MSRVRIVWTLRAAAGAGVLALGAILVWNLTHQHTGAARKIVHGKVVAAPAFDLKRLDATGRLSLASMRGKVVVLNFWASDCLPCKQEMPRLEAAAKQWAGRPVQFVGVDVGPDSTSAARAFVERYGATYPMIVDPVANLAGDYGVYGTPMTYFVDRRGRVVPPRIVGVATGKTLAAGIRRALAA